MAEKSPVLSVVIISYNTSSVTGDCIRSILRENKSMPAFEILVVDNASKDDSVPVLRKLAAEYPTLKVIENSENAGFAKANNQAVKQARGQYILLLNSDTVVLDDAVGRLFKTYTEDPRMHFLGGKLLNRDMTPQASAAPFYTLPVVFGALFLKGDYWGLTRGSPDKTTHADWVSGACILTKKEYYDAVGGFDEGIFMYMDEVDLLFRARKKGYETYFYPGARFIHLGSASSQGKTYPILQVYRGFLYFYRKHYGAGEVSILKIMLQLKALLSLAIGKVTRNAYLIETYEKAYKLAR